jgi:hypothetical protein
MTEDGGKTTEEDEAKTMQDSTSPNLMDVPEEWKSLPLQEMVDQGWKPRTKKVRGQLYLTLRKGQHDKSLGPYSEDKWNLLREMFPILKDLPEELSHVDVGNVSQKAEHAISSGGLLGTKMTRPEALSAHVGFSLETLNWYEWTKGKGFIGTLSDFVDSIIHNYFSEHGLQPVVMIEQIESGN